MLLDTGSPDLWVYSQQACEETQECPARDSYYVEGVGRDYKEFEDQGEYNVSFALGSVQGSIAQDRICIGSDTTEEEQTGAAGCIERPVKFLKVSRAAQMDNYQSSGFLGLAPRSQIPDHKSFIEQVDESEEGMQAVFSIYLTKEEYYYGKLVFGGFDLKYAASGLTSDDIFWADMHSNHNYWVANMGSISFKEKQKEDDEKERAPV